MWLCWKEVAHARNRQAGLCGTAHLAFKDVVERQLAAVPFLEVEAVHADHALALAEGGKAVFGEAAVADERAARPRRRWFELAVERVQVGHAGRRLLPLGLHQIGFALEYEAMRASL